MKKILLTIIVITACFAGKAQLANHKWVGSLPLDNQPTDVILDFKKDSVSAIIAASGESLEQMLYTVKKDVVTFQKVDGRSGCGTDVIGKYKFELKADSITLTLVEDICIDRAGVLDKSKWTKQKN
jgi:hypothetical protein